MGPAHDLSPQVLDRIKGTGTMSAALTGIRAALVGMAFASAVVIGRRCEYHWATLVIFFMALNALMRFKIGIAYPLCRAYKGTPLLRFTSIEASDRRL